jgi:hypothetical protein
MPIRLLPILRDIAIVFVATLVAGLLVALTLGQSSRGTPLWNISMTLAVAVFSIGAFFASAHLATTNRFAHVYIVAALSAIPTSIYYAIRTAPTLATFAGPIVLMLVYASAGAGLSYVVRRSGPAAAGPRSNTSLERTREG